MLLRIVPLVLAAMLAGCGGTVHTDPNAATAESKREILQDSISWEVDTRQLTETAAGRRGIRAVALEADFDDGTSTWVTGTGGSAFGVQRALEGAIRSALHALLIDPQFNAYMHK